MNIIKKLLAEWHLSFFLLVVFIILPLINFHSTIDPELAPRFFITSLLLLTYSVYFFISNKSFNIPSTEAIKIFALTVLMLLCMLLSMFQSVNKGDALLEWFRLGVVYCFLVVSFFILSSASNPLKLIFRAAVFALFIFAFYGVQQFISVLPDLYKGKNVHVNEIVTSSLANKNFFSEVLVLILPFLIYGFIMENGFWKFLFVTSLVVDLLFIGFLQSMSAWAAIIIGSIIFFLSAAKNKLFDVLELLSKRRNKIIGATLILALFAGSYFYLETEGGKRFSSKFKLAFEYVLNPDKLSETLKENNNSVFERILLWRNTIRMYVDHPLIGVGMNNWKLINPLYGIGGTQYINTGFVNYEHPHNDYLLILAEQGPIGILLYLFFFIYAFILIRKLIASGKHSKTLLLLLQSGIVAFMILSMFGYPRSRFYSMLILMIIFSILLSMKTDEKVKNVSGRSIAIFIFLISLFGSYVSYCRLSGEVHTKKMLIAQLNRNYARMIREADMAESWLYPMDLTSTPFNWYKGMAYFYSGHVSEAIEQYEKASLINPNHLRILNDLGSSYEHIGERQKAISFYRKALSITPYSIEVNLNLSAAYFNLRNIDSSFYFIDKIYKNPMSVSENKNYNQFLDAILYAKAYTIISHEKDTAFIKSGLTLINDKNLLKGFYSLSKEENRSFAKILDSRVKQR